MRSGRLRVLALVTLAALVACPDDDPREPTPNPDGVATLELNDLSILMPPPGEPWLRFADAARGGVLVPTAMAEAASDVAAIPALDAFDVVAIRADPCFRGQTGDACQPQLRLVFQMPQADIAFHALYRLSEAELDRWLTLLIELRRTQAEPDATPRPLGVHDIVSRQGLDGEYATTLRALLVELCGEANLVRLTHFALDGAVSSAFAWRFDGVIEDGSELVGPAGDINQSLLLPLDGRSLAIMGALTTLEAPLGPQFDVGGGAVPAGLEAALLALVRLENPRATLADEVTCAGCHVASPLRHAIALAWPDVTWPDEGYSSDHPVGEILAPLAGGGGGRIGRSFRLFGYFNNEPVVSLRVARETADVKDMLVANGR